VTDQPERVLPASRQPVPGSPEPRPNGKPLSATAPRSPREIERDIEATRQRLAGTLDELVDKVAPANVARRATASVKAQFVDTETGVRTGRVVVAAAVVVALIALRIMRRGR
jgi:hypothetical protein